MARRKLSDCERGLHDTDGVDPCASCGAAAEACKLHWYDCLVAGLHDGYGASDLRPLLKADFKEASQVNSGACRRNGVLR